MAWPTPIRLGASTRGAAGGLIFVDNSQGFRTSEHEFDGADHNAAENVLHRGAQTRINGRLACNLREFVEI